MLSISGKSSSASVVSLVVRQDDKPKADKTSVDKVKSDHPSKNPSDDLTLSAPKNVTGSDHTADDDQAEATEQVGSASSGNPSEDEVEQLISELEKTYVLVNVRESSAKGTGKDLTSKFDALQAQFNELSEKVDDLNAVSEKLDKLTQRFEKLIKVMFQGGSGKGGNLNLANLNAALAVARLSQNVALGFGGAGSNGLLQNLSGIGGFVHSQNLLLQSKGLDGTLRSVTQLKKAFEAQLTSLSDQLQELGSSLDANA